MHQLLIDYSRSRQPKMSYFAQIQFIRRQM
jgi:hypothetical protein